MQRSIVLLSFTTMLFAAGMNDIPLLRWAGPPGSKPDTYAQWIAKHPYTEFSCTLDRMIRGDGRAGSVAILTEQNLAPILVEEILELSNNLQSEGYTVYSYEITGGTPETLRTFLAQLHSSDSIEGALFIGNLPVAWFEVYDFGGALADFPMDLYYMDLDGTWLDTISTGNGIYDGHIGATKPEIYIGRLMPTGMGIDTVLLNHYFEKDIDFRNGLLPLPQRALVFVDNDWVPWAVQWASDVARLFPDTMFYWQPETTRASFYRERLDTAQTWVSVFAHSWPGGHQFVFDNGNQYDYYYSSEYVSQDPPASFYNFFACSFSRYTQGGYGGGRAIFNEGYGIGSIGSTKTGSMLDFNFFYEPLSQGQTLGQAFKYWFDCIYDSVGMTFDRLCWHYGMTLLGDPFLKPTGYNTYVAEHKMNVNKKPALVIMNNPVSELINLTLHLETAGKVKFILHDCLGRVVRDFRDQQLTDGTHHLTINLNDGGHDVLPSGIYFLKATIGTSEFVKKIIKID
jgi:hypothetical protein